MKTKLQAALKEAMKAKDQARLGVIRGVLAAMQYEAMEKKVEELSDEQSTAIIQREIKKRKEEMDFAGQAKRAELIAPLEAEIKALEVFLPSQLTAQDIEKILVEAKAQPEITNMGAAMKVLKERFAGQYDGKVASEIAKRVFG
jgi:uncharacterized protein YqeY